MRAIRGTERKYVIFLNNEYLFYTPLSDRETRLDSYLINKCALKSKRVWLRFT